MPTTPITDQADDELLYEVLNILREDDNDEARNDAIENKIPRLRKKTVARNKFIDLLEYGKESGEMGWDSRTYTRAWAATALEKLCGANDQIARDAISKHFATEKDEITRFWMLLALHKMGIKDKSTASVIQSVADDFAKYLSHFGPDDNPDMEGPEPAPNLRAGPLALAILASKQNQKAVKSLEKMLLSGNVEWMWSACRALEMVNGREMLEPLQRLLDDPRTWPDVRNRAVRAIGKIESPAAVRVLNQVLINGRDVMIKESAIEGLERLGKSRLVQSKLDQIEQIDRAKYHAVSGLISALLDKNAEIRFRAAKALPMVLADLKTFHDDNREEYEKALNQARLHATQMVVEEIIRESRDPKSDIPQLVDALRVIDSAEAEAAATVLSKYLFNEDISVKQRAEQALKLVGGERAVQTLMGQKSEVLQAYSNLLARADEPIQDLFKETMRQAQRSFNISQGMSLTVFIVGIFALIGGLYIAFTAGQDGIQRVFGAGTTIIGIIAVLLDMLLRDPHKRVEESTSILLRTKVIFLGYVRQIHQLDATFKHKFIEGGKDFGVKDVQDTINNITDVMKNTMALIDSHLTLRKTEKLAVDDVLKTWQERIESNLKGEEAKAAEGNKGGREKPKEKQEIPIKDANVPA